MVLSFIFARLPRGHQVLFKRHRVSGHLSLVMTALGVIIQKGLLYGNLFILPVLPPGWLESCFKGRSPVEYWLLRFRL